MIRNSKDARYVRLEMVRLAREVQLLKALSNRPEREGFCLSGGTALAAFYLKHRRSRDLDFFASEEVMIVPFSFAFEKVLQDSGLKIDRKRVIPEGAGKRSRL